MIYPTKPGNEDYQDTMVCVKKLAYSIYHRKEEKKRVQNGPSPQPRFEIKLINLDRFIPREIDEYRIEGSNPPERLISENEVEVSMDQKLKVVLPHDYRS